MASELERAVIEAAREFVDSPIGHAQMKALVIAVLALDARPTVTRLRDRDGDVWTLRGNGRWSIIDSYGTYRREQIEENYGPLTEVSDGE